MKKCSEILNPPKPVSNKLLLVIPVKASIISLVVKLSSSAAMKTL